MAQWEYCEREIPPGLLICPQCGRRPPGDEERKRRMKRISVVIGITAVFMLLLLLRDAAMRGTIPHFS
jgi:hypothetical protein